MSENIRRKRIYADDAESEPTMQLAPLVDIVFLLLVFFLVATEYIDNEKDLTVKLPAFAKSAGSKKDRPKLERVLINIRDDGTIILENTPATRDQLWRVLVEARRDNPEIPVIVRGDKSVSYGEIFEIVGLCKKASIQNISLAGQEDSKE